MTTEKHDPQQLEHLAHEIAEELVTEMSESGSGEASAVFIKKQTCPPGKLCCFNEYDCAGLFVCRAGFHCSGNFRTTHYPVAQA